MTTGKIGIADCPTIVNVIFNVTIIKMAICIFGALGMVASRVMRCWELALFCVLFKKISFYYKCK